MNLQLSLFLFSCFVSISLHAQENSQALSTANPLGNALYSQALFGSNTHLNEAYIGIQTLPFYAFATSYQWVYGRQFENGATKAGLSITGLQLGAYREQRVGIFMRKQFSSILGIYFMPRLGREAVTAYGHQVNFGADFGGIFKHDAWEIATLLRANHLGSTGNLTYLFNWRYVLSKDYALLVFVQSGQRRAIRYGAELLYQKSERKKLILGIDGTQHYSLRYQSGSKSISFSFGLHYAPVQGFYPDNGLRYAF